MSHAHDFLTEQTFALLAEDHQGFWSDVRKQMVDAYCWYPDWWYSPEDHKRNAARPYVCVTNDVPFHYLPANPIEYNNWRVDEDGKLHRLANQPNLHWMHFSRGCTQTLSHVLEAFDSGETDEAAKYVGVLLHVIQDAGSLAHVQEGLDGTDAFALERLLRPPEDSPEHSVSRILNQNDAVGFDRPEYRPRLLGEGVSEIVFHCYTRLCDLIRDNRFELIPVIQHAWGGDIEKVQACVGIINKRICVFCADLLYTVASVVQGRLESEQLEELSRVHLEQVQPIHRPYFLPGYGGSPIIINGNLNADGQVVPLRLRLRLGETQVFEHGMGTGCHSEYMVAYDLPADVYQTFSAAVGLHADLGRDGSIEVEVRMAGSPQFLACFDKDHPAERLEVTTIAGGLLELYVRDKSGDWGNPCNHVVWGDPRLKRRSVS